MPPNSNGTPRMSPPSVLPEQGGLAEAPSFTPGMASAPIRGNRKRVRKISEPTPYSYAKTMEDRSHGQSLLDLGRKGGFEQDGKSGGPGDYPVGDTNRQILEIIRRRQQEAEKQPKATLLKQPDLPETLELRTPEGHAPRNLLESVQALAAQRKAREASSPAAPPTGIQPAVYRPGQEAGFGQIGQGGIIKAGMPVERPMDWKGAFEEAGRTLGRAAGLDAQAEEAEPQRNADAPWMPSPSAGNKPDPVQVNDQRQLDKDEKSDASAPMEIDLERYWKTDHDGWQGTVEDMAKQVGIDQGLFGDAPAEAQIALAGAVAFRHLDKQQQRDVLTLIMNLEQGENTRLAHRLRGYVAEQHSLGGMRHPETMSQSEMKELEHYYQNMKEISLKAKSVLEKVDGVPLPSKPSAVVKVLKGLAALSKEQAVLSLQSLEEEKQRRQR